jgi:membrane-associated phospholipid phosphatase
MPVKEPRPGIARAALPVATVLLSALLIPAQVFNVELFSFLNGLHSPYTDILWHTLTTLGDGLLLGIVLGALLTVNPRVTVLGLAMLVLASLTANAIKAAFPTLRPASVLDSVHVIGPLLRSGAFPSGHTAAAMATGLAVSFYCRNRFAAALVLLLAVLVSVSRIFVGAHFPRDVVGGMLCSVVLFYAIVAVVWPAWEEAVPGHPPYESRFFKCALYLEITAALFTLLVYAPFYSDLPGVAGAVALAVLIFLAYKMLVLRRRNPFS